MDPSDGNAHDGGKEEKRTVMDKEPMELRVARNLLHRRMKVWDATFQTTAVPLPNGVRRREDLTDAEQTSRNRWK